VRKVQSRSNPNLERSATGSSNYLVAILGELALSHNQIED
jgi:hypothetical protein